jgi:hypothetical protein
MRLRPVPLALFAALLSSSVASAQELPAPRSVPQQTQAPVLVLPPRRPTAQVLPPAGKPIPTMPLAASPYPPAGYRPSAYQVWQNYGVTYNGWLRPRVIQSDLGSYWLYNGAPYPYASTWPGRHMPSIGPLGVPGP